MKRLMVIGFLLLTGFDWNKDVKDCLDNVAKQTQKANGSVEIAYMVSALEDCQDANFRISAKAASFV